MKVHGEGIGFVAKLAVFCMLLALGLPAWQDTVDTQPVVSAALPPAGTERLPVQWMKVSAPGQGVMLLAVARPKGAGPFPAVLLLHGTHGFAQQYVQLAEDLARGGLLAVAACWFSGGGGGGSRFMTPIGCPDAPPVTGADSPDAIKRVATLLRAVRLLPRVQPDRVALFGHSRGGGAALHYVLTASDVRAAVLNSTGYPTGLSGRVSQITTPILMFHGARNDLADGGSALSNIQMARDFEASLRRAGKPVEFIYYEEGAHNTVFTNSAQYKDEVRRMLAFLRPVLRN
jgi:dienelactone hydrolase